MKLDDIFNFAEPYYHQITDEDIYKSIGDIPIITGRNQIKGYWNKQIINKNDLPCITYAVKGNPGDIYIQNQIFDTNNTAVLILKSEFKNKIDLYWMCHKLRTIFKKIQISKEGVSYLNKNIVKDIELDTVDIEIQQNESEKILELFTLREKLEKIINKITKLKSSTLIIGYKKYQGRKISVKQLFNVINGNSGLTEETIYQNIDLKGAKEKFEVLSSSTIDSTKMGFIPICKINDKIINIFEDKKGIQVIRNGEAGKAFYLKPGKYTLNDHAYILFLKEGCKYKINLRWFIYQHQKLLYEYSSFTDNGTWNKTGFFKYAKIDIPDIKEQEQFIEKFEKLYLYEKEIKKIYNHINNLLDCEPI